MARQKATHLGNCQICDALHKLPGGVVATHGYNVTDHQFWGQCPGSNHPPYQISCDVIKCQLVFWEEMLAKVIKESDELKESQGTRGTKGWKKLKNEWIEVEYINKPGTKVIGYRINGGEFYGRVTEFGDPVDAARKGDSYYMRSVLETKLQVLTSRVEIATHRIKVWSLSDTLPL